MDLIERQDVLSICQETYWNGADAYYPISARGIAEKVKGLPSIETQPEQPQWHKCFEDDPDSLPDDDRNVLMSFSNYPTPAVGWFQRDEDGGGYGTDGGQKTIAELGLFVDGWWELPKKPR